MEITKIVALIIFTIIISIIYINIPKKKLEQFENNDNNRFIIRDINNNTEDEILNNKNFIIKEEVESRINTNNINTSNAIVNGNISIKENAYVGKSVIIGNKDSNKWILQASDDNKKGLIIAPFVNGKLDWNKQVNIKSDGVFIENGNLKINGDIISDKTLNVKGGESIHNPKNYWTHFPWNGDDKNYIRGDTEIRGNVTNIGNTIGNHCIVYGPDNKYKFCFEKDGNVVQYKDGSSVWSSKQAIAEREAAAARERAAAAARAEAARAAAARAAAARAAAERAAAARAAAARAAAARAAAAARERIRRQQRTRSH